MQIVASHWHNRVDNADVEYLERIASETLDGSQSSLIAGSTRVVRGEIREALLLRGWSDEAKISAGSDLTIFSRFDRHAFQVQFGNISRAAYDLLKLQYLFSSRSIRAAVYALPVKDAALRLGSNIANYERILSEIGLFNGVITLPLFLVGVE